MALDDNRISFGVDVSTGQSEESINKVIDRIDGLKDKINELKKLRTENKQDADIFSNYTKSIRDTERELSKLQSVYNSWIQKATNIDTKPIGDVKKQTQEFISLLKQWDGQSATFQKQVMSHFMIPNSAVDQLRLYKNIMQEIEGIQSKNTIKNFPAYKALQQLTDMAQVAQKSVERLNATLSNTALGAYRRWNGEGSFVNTLPGYGDYNSLSKRRRQVKSAYDELVGYFGADAKDIPAAQSALKQLEEEYQKLTRMAKEAKEALNGTQTDTSKIDKQKQSTEQLAEAEQKLSRIRQQLKDWDGASPFSSTINGFSGMDSYARQIQALRRAYEELNATNTRPLNSIRPFTQEEAAIRSVKAEYDALVAKKNQVDAELKKGTEDVAKASKKAADEESANVKKTIDEYTRLKLKMAEIQEQIKNNYVTNFKTSPALYNTNFTRLSAEYKEVAEAVNQADRNMARLATRADLAGRAMDRLYQRSAWFFSAIGANAIIAVPNAWYDAQTKIENSMAQFSQVMATNSHSVNAFKTALFDMDFGKLQQGLNTTSVQSKEFSRDLEYMKNSLANLAIKYGEASDDVIKSATLWGRKYKDNQTVLTMTNAAMKLAVADSFSIVEANKNLESSLVQWGFQIKDNNDAMIVSNKIIDSWTALAHKMAVSAQDLSAANQRAAQSMRAVGLSFDEGQALIATMLANTQQAGGEIGNAIKSIMGSIHSKKAITDLEAMGVAVYKFGENGKKEFREVGQVLVDLMLKTQNSKENLENLLKDVSGGKWQWNKLAASLDYSTYIQALNLSLTSYGFTQEQVGMQMNTLQRRAMALKQALLNLTTSTNGALSEGLKLILNTLTDLIQHLNEIPSSVLGFTALLNLIVYKGPAAVRGLKAIGESILGIGNKTREAMSAVDKASVITRIITLAFDAAVAFGAFNTKADDTIKEIEDLNNQLTAQTELIARQEEGLASLETLGEAWRTINEQMQQYQEGSDEYNQLAEQKNQTEQTFIDLLGEEDEQTLINQGVSEEAIQSIKEKKTEQINTEKSGLEQVRQAIRYKRNEAIDAARKEMNAIKDVTLSQYGLAWELLATGNIIDGMSVAWRWMCNAALEAIAEIDDAMASTDEMIMNSAVWKFAVKHGFVAENSPFTNSYRDAIQSRDAARAQIAHNNEVINYLQNKDAWNEMAKVAEQIKNIGGNLSDGGFGGSGASDPSSILTPGQMGGSEVGSDDDDSGKSKKGKKESSSREGKPSYDGIELKEVNEDNYKDDTNAVGELTPDTIAKLRTLDEAVYTKFGQHVEVTSSYRPNDTNSNHSRKAAFDLSGGVMNDPNVRYWVEHLAPYIGLFTIDEYGNNNPEIHRDGSNVHFSNVTPGIYGETRWAEGAWSEDNSAPTLGSILGKGIDSGKSQYIDNSVQRQVYDLLYSKLGLTDKQAWAAMANIDGESSFDPAAEEHPGSSSGGIGLMSWTDDRRDNLLEFAKQRQTDWRDLKTQLAFIEYEYNGSEAESWQRFKDFVTDQTTPEQDVEYFAGPLGPERAGDKNLANRMKNYYNYDSHYAKGMSFYDSNPSKQKKKEITPEERAEKEAQRFQQMFGAIDKSLNLLSKSFSGKFKTILESVQEDQKYFGSNIDNTTKQLDTYSKQLKSVVYMQNQYQQAITKVSTFLDDKGVKAVLGVSKDKFLAADLSEQQKMMSKQATGSKLYQPTIVALNEILKLKQNIQKQDEEYHKVQLQWVDTYQKRLKNLYEDTIWSEQASIKEWEIRHSNEKYDDWYKYFAEQDHLEAIARQYREEYEEAQKPLLDENGHQVYDSEGNPLNRIENDPKKLEELREKWLSAEEAAKKYSATLRNSVQDSFHDLTKSVLLEGGSLRDKLKELWKGLADDALSLLLSGGKSGTNSPLGNLLRMFVLRHQQQNVKFYDKQHFDYGSQAMWDTSAEQFGAYNFKPQRNYWRQFMGQAKYLYYNPMPIDMLYPEAKEAGSEAYRGNYKGFRAVDLVTAATKFDGKPFNPLNPVPVTIVNGGPLQDALTDIPNTLTNQPTTPSSGAFDYGQLGSFNGGIVGQKPSNIFANATRYNWMGQFANYGSGGWGVIPIGQKLGMFANGLPWLFSLFGHHAEGGEVDKEQISYLAEGNKKEYVIPTQAHRNRGIALWQKAGKDLGVLKEGSPVEPDFKNKDIAQNGIMSVQVKQQAIYMEQMKQQNKTLLNILTVIADNQQSGGNGTTVAQPIVMKQSMDMDDFGEMLNRFNRYGYNR